MHEINGEAFVAETTGGLRLGDTRLEKRMARLVAAALEEPAKSFPAMAEGEAALEGTYRFLGNPKVTPEAMLAPHFRATAERVKAEARVILAHDSSLFSYGPIPRGDLKRVGKGTSYGFYAHVSLAIRGDEKKRPLGVLAVTPYDKRFKRDGPAGDEDNSMVRWAAHVQQVRQRLGPSTNVIHVMDAEADDYNLLAELSAANERFVVRQSVDRRLVRHRVQPKVRDVFVTLPVMATRQVALSARRKPTKKKHMTRHPLRKARTAQLVVRAHEVTIPKTASADAEGPDCLTLHLIHVAEPHPPRDEKPVEWWLWTNEAIETATQVLAAIDAYTTRWCIEEFFKALKTGCALEKRQLESNRALTNALALFVPIAWRLLLLRSTSRATPTALASEALTPLQVRALRGYMLRKRHIVLPKRLTARDALLAIAAMGGHLKNNGEPGWMVLGRGFDRLLTVELGLSLAQHM